VIAIAFCPTHLMGRMRGWDRLGGATLALTRPGVLNEMAAAVVIGPATDQVSGPGMGPAQPTPATPWGGEFLRSRSHDRGRRTSYPRACFCCTRQEDTPEHTDLLVLPLFSLLMLSRIPR